MTGAYQFLKKYGVAIGFGVGALLSVLMYVIILSGFPEFSPTKKELYGTAIFDFGIYVTYILIFIAIVLVIIFPAIYAAQNPKESLKGLIGFLVVLVLFFVTYAMGDGFLTEELVNSDQSLLPKENGVPVMLVEGETYSSGLQMADGLIKFGYIMLLLACVTALGATGRDFIKQS